MTNFQTLNCAVVVITLTAAAVSKAESDTVVRKTNTTKCSAMSKAKLTEILGTLYNSRYMSITLPCEEAELQKTVQKRKTEREHPDFYVSENFSQQLGSEPAWSYRSFVNSRFSKRRKRATAVHNQWKCEYRLHWADLGADYFPRYLKSVECTTESCWYKLFKCKPRSFAVKILRRKKDLCAVMRRTGSDDLPAELSELWVWEERAVNFCCDCGL